MDEALRRMNRLSDWDLVAQARADDMRAFTELVTRHQGSVIRFCYRMTGTLHDAEELAQESFVRVYRHLDRLTPDAKFSTVLLGIARNLTLNFLRDAARRGRGRNLPLVDEEGHDLPLVDKGLRPDTTARAREIESMIEQGLNALSPDHREVLVLRELEGLDYEAIGRIVGCPPGTVKSRIARGREQLREHVTRMGGLEL